MNQPGQCSVYDRKNYAQDSVQGSLASGPGIPAPKPSPEIEQVFCGLDGNCERLMKAVSTLVARVQPVSRTEPPTPTKDRPSDRATRMTPVAERIERFNDLINGQIAILSDAADRIEL